MSIKTSPEQLLPLVAPEPLRRPELKPLGDIPETSHADPSELRLVRPPVAEAENQPDISGILLKKPDEVTSEPTVSRLSVLDGFVLTRPKATTASEEPNVVTPTTIVKPTIVKKPFVIKPAIKIGRTAIVKEQVKAVVKSKDKLQSLNLKERGLKLGKAAVAAAVFKTVATANSPKLRKLDDRVINQVKLLKSNITDKKAAHKLKEKATDLPYKAKIFISNGFSDLNESRLNESLGNNKKYLFAAIGLVAVGVSSYLRFSGMQGHGGSGTSDMIAAHVHEIPSSSDVISDTFVTPTQPAGNPKVAEHVKILFEQAPTASDTVDVSSGDGFVDLIKDRFAEKGVEISGAEGYDFYQDLDAKFDGNLITGDTYRMPNGDLGISSPGHFDWQQQAQRALDDMIDAEKKKKS